MAELDDAPADGPDRHHTEPGRLAFGLSRSRIFVEAASTVGEHMNLSVRC